MSQATDLTSDHAPSVGESAPGLSVAQVVLKPRKAQPFFGRHPWVLDSAVAKVEGSVADGDVVDLISDKGKFIARGLFNSRSRLRVRLYTWDPGELLDDALFRRQLQKAIELRRQLGYTDPGGAARLVFSEGDGLSGLVVDRYGEYLAVQATALAIHQRLERLVPMLFELVPVRGIVLREERGAVQMEGLPHEAGRHWGELPAGPAFIEEHGLRYGVDLREGQKTGFYLDQRENRARRRSSCAAGACSTCSATAAGLPSMPPNTAAAKCCASTPARRRLHWRRQMPSSTAWRICTFT